MTPSARDRTLLFLLLVVSVNSGCMGTAVDRDQTGAAGNRTLISEDEVHEWIAAGVGDALELLERARPRWLRTARTRSLNTPVRVLVYQGNTLLGGVQELRSIPISAVREVRWLSAAEAGTLPGASSVHVEGAIVLTLWGGGSAVLLRRLDGVPAMCPEQQHTLLVMQ